MTARHLASAVAAAHAGLKDSGATATPFGLAGAVASARAGLKDSGATADPSRRGG